jgi:rhodanese-related sulfurtransferase
MAIIFYFLISSVLFFVLGCYLTKKKFINHADTLLEDQKKERKSSELKLINEQTAIADQLFQANKLKIEHQANQLNNAFLENGRTVGIISGELKSAQNLVANTFSSLPNIHTCSQSSYNATQKSKTKIEALSLSVNSWQSTMQSLENIQILIDDIHEKASQIRDISSEANLLALNASIEAARAGEHGRGFAVVASSMRELSNKSAEATFDINTAVENTRNEVNVITNDIGSNISLLSEVSSDVSNSFANIENEVNNIANIAQTSLSEADDSNHQFKKINDEVNTQLESIIGLLADTLGEITGIKIKNLSVSSDFSEMVIIDVRSQTEFNDELGHIEKAKHLCLQDDFERQLEQLDKKANYLFVCRSGGRSSRAARIALGLGFHHINNMQGGMLEYCKVNGTPTNTTTPSPSKTTLNSLPPDGADNEDITLF